ncbi:MAG: DUF4862 family protein [Rhodoglobus sp.]
MDTNSRGIIVGAYAASPTHSRWNPPLEAEFLTALSSIPGVAGIELPWINGIHPHDNEWLLSNFPSNLDVMITDIGGTVTRLAADSHFGLASSDRHGRAAALDQVKRVRDDAERLNNALGRAGVVAIELHSAPLATGGHSAALAESLAEISLWDWAGAALLVEHCDALVDGQKPEKGYLTLQDEIAAIAASEAEIGISLNWGRSAIELRSAERVIEHITLAASSGLLRSMIFSGASDHKGAFGGPWEDSHLPLVASREFPYGDEHSLLTLDRVRQSLEIADALDWVGVKFGWKRTDLPVESRVHMLRDAVKAVASAAL